MFKVVKKIEPVFPVCEISHVERLVKEENKILVCVYEKYASFLISNINNGDFFFYGFYRKDVHSRSESLKKLLTKQNIGTIELYLFDSMKEFFTVAEQQGWNY
jgi:hypothetical protein